MKIKNEINSYLIDNYKVYIEENETYSKIMIDNGFTTYSTEWGAMGKDTNIYWFICSIDEDYFSNRLVHNTYKPNWKTTFTNIRKHIREELDLPWYRHQEFQKDMRLKINDFYKSCRSSDSADWFVSNIDFYLVSMMDFNLINDRWDSEDIEKNFKYRFNSEPWYFITESYSDEYLRMRKLHKSLKKYFKSMKIGTVST